MDRLLSDFFKRNNLKYEKKTFVIAVSTGIDSSVLLDLFLRFKENIDINIVVAHVNHHKRKQSEKEQQYITEKCQEENLRLFVKELYFDNLVGNFQQEARKMRYQFFSEVIKEVNGDYLVLAHHGNDNTETVLMRMLRGSSLTGYAGMQEVMSGNIIRPLLSVSKEDIINYQKMHKIKYYEDESNSSSDYTRNRIRHELIPILEKECPNYIEKINEFSQTIKNASLVVNNKRDEFISKHVIKENDGILVRREELKKLDLYMAEEVLFEILKKEYLSKGNIKEIIKIINSSKPNNEVEIKSGLLISISYDNVFIKNTLTNRKSLNRESKKIVNVLINDLGKYYINDNLIINVFKKSEFEEQKKDDMCYNISELPIIIRSRLPGDKINLSFGSKKVKDLLIDLKIDTKRRNELLVATNKNNEILNIFGIKKSILLKNINECDIIIRIENVEVKNG